MEPCIKTIWKWDTVYSADSVEWCPIPEFTFIFVCGTYQLSQGEEKENKSVRLGRIYLFAQTESLEPKLLQTIETSAILDQKWSRCLINGYPTLACVTADGSVQLYHLREETTCLKLILSEEKSLKSEETLALSVDWSNNKIPSESPQIVVSDSKGFVYLFKLNGSLEEEAKWKAHDYEGWIAAFNCWNPQIFYTGGDDCLFKVFDSRVAADKAVFINRTHQAGVTTFNSSFYAEHHLLSGSYDEFVRQWDDRNLRAPVNEKNAGGGIWRLRTNPRDKNIVLAACMYDGFKIVKTSEDRTEVIEEYKEHTSIAYGADWQQNSAGRDYFATCSFYDCKLHLCEYWSK